MQSMALAARCVFVASMQSARPCRNLWVLDTVCISPSLCERMLLLTPVCHRKHTSAWQHYCVQRSRLCRQHEQPGIRARPQSSTSHKWRAPPPWPSHPSLKTMIESSAADVGGMAGREGQNGLHSRSLSGEGLPGSLLGPGGRRRTSSSQQGGAAGPGQGRSRRVSYAAPPFLASNGPEPARSPFETELTAVLPQPQTCPTPVRGCGNQECGLRGAGP